MLAASKKRSAREGRDDTRLAITRGGASGRVPTPAAGFVGRAKDLSGLRAAVESGERRITLLGTGGMGKTRLAVQFGRQLIDEERFSGGVWFCDLAAAHNLEEILIAVGRALSISLLRDSGNDNLAHQVGLRLAERGATLVILDNCEQVVDAVAELTDEWSMLAPELYIVATSRERLKVAGEWVHDVPPLGVVATETGESEAVALFLDRARRLLKDYAPDESEIAAMRELVTRLDGLPLAIELAAARVGVLGTKDMCKHLSHRLDLLTSSGRSVPARQRTMRTTLDWSWELLTPVERSVLEQCSVFLDGFSVAVAERVTDVSTFSDAPPVLDIVQSLMDKSLIHADTRAETPGQRRLAMYETIREYTTDKLRASGKEHEVQERAEAVFAEMGHFGPTSVLMSQLEALSVEFDNLTVVHDRLLARKPVNDVVANRTLRTALALYPVYFAKGPFAHAISRFDRSLSPAVRAVADPSLVAAVMFVRGNMRLNHGASDEGVSDLKESLRMGIRAGDKRMQVQNHRSLANHLLVTTGYTEAVRQHCVDAVRLAREIGDPALLAGTLGTIAGNHREAGQLNRAQAEIMEALAIERSRGPEASSYTVGWALAVLGLVRAEQQEFNAARALIREAIALADDSDTRRNGAWFLGALAMVEHEDWQLAAARDGYERALKRLTDLGDQLGAVFFAAPLAAVLAWLGDFEGAERSMTHAAAAAHTLKNPRETRVTLDLLRALVDLAVAKQYEASGRIDAAERERQKARAQLVAVGSQRALLGDSRWARRLVTRAVGDLAESGRASKTRTAEAAPALSAELLVASDGAWFQPPNRPRVSLGRRRNLRLVLLSLVRHRVQSPGSEVSFKDLVADGWPDELMTPVAARNRMKVTLSRLRKLGMSDVLLTAGDGHLLDPRVHVRIEQED